MSDRRVNTGTTRMVVLTYNTEEELTAKLRAMLNAREEWVSVRTLAERYEVGASAVGKRITRCLKMELLNEGEDIRRTKGGRLRLIRLTPVVRERMNNPKTGNKRRKP